VFTINFFSTLLIFAGAVAMYQPEKGGKEEVVPELWNCPLRILPSEFVIHVMFGFVFQTISTLSGCQRSLRGNL